MEYTFDNVKNREYTNSFKWSAKNLDYEKGKIYPMWVADMEFSVSPAIKRRIIERLDENVYGYEMLSDHYYEAVKYWLKNRHSCKVEKENIMYCSSTMCGLSIVLQTFTLQEDEILLMPPVYGNFYKAVCGCGRKVVESPLMEKNERFTMDFCNMEKVISNRTKGVLLCNPHNPTGTVWKRDELEELCRFCKKHELFIISDEVHYDFIFEGIHIMMKQVADEFEVPVYTLIAPGKSFNIAGIQTAAILTSDSKSKDKLSKKMSDMEYPFEHTFAEAVTIGAYQESEDWLDAVVDYIANNKKRVIDFVKNEIPLLRIPKTEATYLLWIDCSRMKMTEDEIFEFWKHKCGVLPSDGREFGDAGKKFVRLNLACPKERIDWILTSMKQAFDSLK